MVERMYFLNLGVKGLTAFIGPSIECGECGSVPRGLHEPLDCQWGWSHPREDLTESSALPPPSIPFFYEHQLAKLPHASR